MEMLCGIGQTRNQNIQAGAGIIYALEPAISNPLCLTRPSSLKVSLLYPEHRVYQQFNFRKGTFHISTKELLLLLKIVFSIIYSDYGFTSCSG